MRVDDVERDGRAVYSSAGWDGSPCIRRAPQSDLLSVGFEQPTNDRKCLRIVRVQLNAPTASRLVAVSTIVSSKGRDDQPRSFSAFALDGRRTLPSSNNWPLTSLSKSPTNRTTQSGSLRVGTFFALSPKRSFRTFAISLKEINGPDPMYRCPPAWGPPMARPSKSPT